MKMTGDGLALLIRQMASHINSESSFYKDDPLVNTIIQDWFKEAVKIYSRDDSLIDPAWELGLTIHEMCREIADKAQKNS